MFNINKAYINKWIWELNNIILKSHNKGKQFILNDEVNLIYKSFSMMIIRMGMMLMFLSVLNGFNLF